MNIKVYFFFFTLIFMSATLHSKDLSIDDYYNIKENILNNKITIEQFNKKIDELELYSEIFLISKDLFLNNELKLEDYLEVIENLLISENSSNYENENNVSEEKTSKIFSEEYIFQSEITKLSQYVVGDLKYGELFDNKIVIENNDLKEISMSQNNVDVLKFVKPKLVIKDNKIIIKSRVIDSTAPSETLQYRFEGKIDNNSIKGKILIYYEGGEILLVELITINKTENNLSLNNDEPKKEINLKLIITKVNNAVPATLKAKVNNIENLTIKMDGDNVKEIKFEGKSNNFFNKKVVKSFKNIKISLKNKKYLKGKSRLVLKEFSSENVTIYWDISIDPDNPSGKLVLELLGKGPQIELTPL